MSAFFFGRTFSAFTLGTEEKLRPNETGIKEAK
jgi:hypothetical protein